MRYSVWLFFIRRVMLLGLHILLASTVYASLPDLTLNTTDIMFSNNSPEPDEVITISATIHNTGGEYYIIAVSSHDYMIGTSSDGFLVQSVWWYGQYFTVSSDLCLGKVDLLIRNIKSITTDYIRVEIRNDAGDLEPVAGVSNFLAEKSLNTTTTNYYWQDFYFSTPPFLSSGVTYWICVGSIEISTCAYGWYLDTDVPVSSGISVSSNKGGTWSKVQGYIGYYRAYGCEDTIVAFYDGDPGTTTVNFISSHTLTKAIPGGGSEIATSTWSAVLGVHNIYVAVDYPSPGIITESPLESSNTAYRSINVEPTAPWIVSVSPAEGSSGINITDPIRVTFSEEMNSSSVKEAISVRVFRDNKGIRTGELVVGTTTEYEGEGEGEGEVLTFTATWNKGYTYQVTISTSARDLYVTYLVSSKTWTFNTLIDYTMPNTFVGSDGKTKVIIEGQTLIGDYYIEIDTFTALNNEVTQANDKIKRIRGSFSHPINGSLREFTIRKGTCVGTEFTGIFKHSVRIVIPYTELNNGIVQDGNGMLVKEEMVSIYYLDEENNLWIKIPDSEVDPAGNTVTATVNHFSVYALLGESDTDLSYAYAYPVPWKPFDGKDKTGTLGEGITFTNLGSQSTIRIYNISGELVRVLYYRYTGGSGGEQKNWDVTNRHGQLLASGLYIYYIENAKEHKTGKLIIIK